MGCERADADLVLVVDFGAQYAQLIARRVREAHVYSEIVPRSMPIAEMLARKPKAIIFSGGPASVHVDGAPSIDAAIYDAGVPLLGICYGAQLIARDLGGEVRKTGTGEYGRTELRRDGSSPLFDGQPAEQIVWMSHGDSITLAPPGFEVTAHTDAVPVAALEDRERVIYGVQFHPEVVHTERGQEVLKAFLYEAAGCRPAWTNVSIIEHAVAEIRAQVGTERVICGLSGGVDSAVAAALVHKAIGDQLTCVFVDTGLLRFNEAEQVERTFREQFAIDLVHVKAADRFLDALDDIVDPERKRKTIGELFIRVFEEAARDLDDARFSRAGNAVSRHRRVGRRRQREHQVAPQRRRSPRRHGLRARRAAAQPLQGRSARGRRRARTARGDRVAPALPGPRPRGPHHRHDHARARRDPAAADAIVTEEIKRAGLYREIWQSFAVLPAVKTVGVMGDDRTYAYPMSCAR